MSKIRLVFFAFFFMFYSFSQTDSKVNLGTTLHYDYRLLDVYHTIDFQFSFKKVKFGIHQGFGVIGLYLNGLPRCLSGLSFEVPIIKKSNWELNVRTFTNFQCLQLSNWNSQQQLGIGPNLVLGRRVRYDFGVYAQSYSEFAGRSFILRPNFSCNFGVFFPLKK